MATGDIPFKKQGDSGKYLNLTLPGDQAEFVEEIRSTDQEVIDGSTNDKVATPQGVKAAIDAATFDGPGYVEATPTEARQGAVGTKVITPRRGKDQIGFRTFETIAILQAEANITGIADGEAICVLGFLTAGDGGGGEFFVRAAGGGEVENSGTTFELADGRFAQRIYSGEINAKWFGATGDGVTDDTAAIQAAIDHAAYISKENRVFIPSGEYLTTDVIHLGYGVSYAGSPYTSLDVYGSNYEQTGLARGTVIVPQFSDRPAINIQGGRGTKIRNITLAGLNVDYISSNTLWGGSSSVDVRSAASWVDPALSINANSRYAPYAGIAIDAYTYPTPPTPAYPTVTYPSFLGVVGQYNKAPSSVVTMDGMQITGFVVAVVSAPSGNTGQSDFIALNRSLLSNCVYGVSVGNTDGREFSITSCYFNQMHTAMTNFIHGGLEGQIGSAVLNTGFDRMIQILNVPATGSPKGGTISFLNCYSETLWRIGNYGGLASEEQCLTFNNCHFGFQSQAAVNLGYPPSILTIGGEAELIITGGIFWQYKKAFVIYASPNRVSIASTLFAIDIANTPSTLYEKLIHTVSAGQVFIVSTTFIGLPKRFDCRFLRAYNAQTGVQEELASAVSPISSSYRGRPYCIHSRYFAGRFDSNIYTNKHGWASVSKGSLANVARTNRTLTFDYTGRTTDQFETYGPAPGDVLIDATTGSVFYVRARTSETVTAELQNNYYIDDSAVLHIINAISLSVGNFYFMSCRTYATGVPLLGNLSSASDTITNAGAANFNDAPLNELQADDRLFNDPLNEFYASDANNKIVSIDTGTNSIEMTGNLARTITDRVLLPAWVIPPLANA